MLDSGKLGDEVNSQRNHFVCDRVIGKSHDLRNNRITSITP
jgi:hypothetical protein